MRNLITMMKILVLAAATAVGSANAADKVPGGVRCQFPDHEGGLISFELAPTGYGRYVMVYSWMTLYNTGTSYTLGALWNCKVSKLDPIVRDCRSVDEIGPGMRNRLQITKRLETAKTDWSDREAASYHITIRAPDVNDEVLHSIDPFDFIPHLKEIHMKFPAEDSIAGCREI